MESASRGGVVPVVPRKEVKAMSEAGEEETDCLGEEQEKTQNDHYKSEEFVT